MQSNSVFRRALVSGAVSLGALVLLPGAASAHGGNAEDFRRCVASATSSAGALTNTAVSSCVDGMVSARNSAIGGSAVAVSNGRDRGQDSSAVAINTGILGSATATSNGDGQAVAINTGILGSATAR